MSMLLLTLILAELAPQQIGTSANLGLYWLGAVLLVLQIVQFFRPQPALHKQFADKVDTERSLDKIGDSMKELANEFKRWSEDHHGSRRRLHHKVNRVVGAMNYMAGSLEAKDPRTAAQLRTMLESVNRDEEDDE